MNIPQDIRNPFSKRVRQVLNACARFCNNLCSGLGIIINPVNGGVSVGIDQTWLFKWLGENRIHPVATNEAPQGTETTIAANAPADVGEENDNGTEETDSQKIARIGTSTLAARADHVHNIPTLLKKTKTFDKGKGVVFTTYSGDKLTVRGSNSNNYSAAFFVLIGTDWASNNRLVIIDLSNETLTIGCGLVKKIQLSVIQTDTTSTSSTSVATLGWVNDKFWRKITNATGLLFNTNGTLSHKSIGTTSGTVAAGDHNHDSAYAAKTHNHDSAYAAKTHNHDGVYAPVNHTHQTGAHTHAVGEIVASGSSGLRFVVFASGATTASLQAVHLEDLKYTDSAHSGNCLVKVDNNGNVSHSQNKFYDTLEALVAGWDTTSKKLKKVTTTDGTNKAELYTGSLELYRDTPFINFHLENAAAATSRLYEDSYGLCIICSNGTAYAYLSKHPADTTDGSDSTSVESRRIATIGVVNTKAKASNPGSNKTSINPSTARATTDSAPTADTTTWTAGGENGLAIQKLMRTVLHAPTSADAAPVLYGFYRTFTYDKWGRLYSVSAETRVEIDPTTMITWASEGSS